MSIYIKGMEMPKNCGVCRFAGTCGVHKAEEWPDLESIVFNDVIGIDGVRDPDCPLIPVPEHGDLIDTRPFEIISFHNPEPGYENRFMDGVSWMLDKIDNAPVVVPADPEEEGEE